MTTADGMPTVRALNSDHVPLAQRDRIGPLKDLGEGPSDLLALPRAAEALRAAGLTEELSARALREGPLAFLGYELVGDFIH